MTEDQKRRYRRLLRRTQVLQMLGMGRSALKEAVARNDFPKPIILFEHGRLLMWDEDEVLAWLDARFEARGEAEADSAGKIAEQSPLHVSKQKKASRKKDK
jgi:predicted DNA-binding transcriptional regulator AlpA